MFTYMRKLIANILYKIKYYYYAYSSIFFEIFKSVVKLIKNL